MSEPRPLRILVAGGGTGGHLYPGIAIAEEVKAATGGESVFVGTARGLETRLVPAAGFELRLINIGALNRVDLATRLKTLLDLPRAVITATKLMQEFRPDVVIGVGGYAS